MHTIMPNGLLRFTALGSETGVDSEQKAKQGGAKDGQAEQGERE